MKREIVTRLTEVILGIAVLAFTAGTVGVIVSVQTKNAFMLIVWIGGAVVVVELILLAVFSVQQDMSINEGVDSLVERGELTMTVAKRVNSLSRRYFPRIMEQSTVLQDTSDFVSKVSSIMQKNEEEMERSNQIAEAARVSAQQSSETLVDMQISAGQVSTSIVKLYEAIKAIEETSVQINSLIAMKNDGNSISEEGTDSSSTAKVKYLNERMRALSGAVGVILKDNIEKTKMHSDLAGDTGRQLEKVAKDSQRISSIVDEVTNDSHEQIKNVAAVIEGIGRIVRTLQQHTQEVKENIQTSEELSGHVEILQEGVGEVSSLIGGTAARAVKIEPERVGEERRGRISSTRGGGVDQKGLKERAERLTTEYFNAIFASKNNEVSVDNKV